MNQKSYTIGTITIMMITMMIVIMDSLLAEPVLEPTLCIKFYKINTLDTISAAKGSSGNYECVFLCVKGCLVQPLITICKNLFT